MGGKLERAENNKNNWSPPKRFAPCVPFIILKKNSEYKSHQTKSINNQPQIVFTLTTMDLFRTARFKRRKEQSNNAFTPILQM
jgi:hypothetical protein